jgi:hypothetical protein
MDLRKILLTIDGFEERKSFEWIISKIGNKTDEEQLNWLKEAKNNTEFEEQYRTDIINQCVSGILRDCFEANVILHIESFMNDLYLILFNKLNKTHE